MVLSALFMVLGFLVANSSDVPAWVGMIFMVVAVISCLMSYGVERRLLKRVWTLEQESRELKQEVERANNRIKILYFSLPIMRQGEEKVNVVKVDEEEKR